MTSVDFINEWRSGSEYITAHTSGSTGTPKKISLPRSLILASALRTNNFFKINEKSRLHLCLSPDYIAGKMMIIRSIEAKARLTEEIASNFPLKNNTDPEEIKLIAVVPSQIPGLLTNNRLPEIRNILVGGSAIPPAIRRMIINSGIRAYESYGMTETASHIALRRITTDTTLPFQLLDGIEMDIKSDGRLRIFSEHFDLLTNDIAEYAGVNKFRYIGRTDNAIICGGVKIHPENVESIISPAFGDTPFCITGKSDPKWGLIPILVLEGRPMKKEKETELLLYLKKLHPAYGHPLGIKYIDKFPLTDSGKIRRCLL